MSSNVTDQWSFIGESSREANIMARIDLIMGAVRQMREWNPGMEDMMQRVIRGMVLYSCETDFAKNLIETLVRDKELLVAMDAALMGDAE